MRIYEIQPDGWRQAAASGDDASSAAIEGRRLVVVLVDVDGVHTGVDRRQQRRELATRRVVGVQVHRQVEALSQRSDQRPGSLRAQQPRHIFDREHVRARRDESAQAGSASRSLSRKRSR